MQYIVLFNTTLIKSCQAPKTRSCTTKLPDRNGKTPRATRQTNHEVFDIINLTAFKTAVASSERLLRDKKGNEIR